MPFVINKLKSHVASQFVNSLFLFTRSLILKYVVILLAAPNISKELDPHVTPMTIDLSGLHGSLSKGYDDNDINCWTSPSGKGFMIRGKNYLKDNSKVS